MKFRWRELLIAVFLAFGFWYGVTGSEKVESQIDVRVDYKGMPSNLTITDGLISRISVRVRAPSGMLRSMYAREDYMFSMDLSGLEQGQNVLPIVANQLPFWGGVEVIDITPSHVTLNVDAVETKVIPVVLNIKNTLPKTYAVNATVTPEVVTIKGPSNALSSVKDVVLDVSASKDMEGVSNIKRSLPLPASIDARPAEAVIHLSVMQKRKQVELKIPVLVNSSGNGTFSVTPQRVTAVLDVPEEATISNQFPSQVKASVTIPARTGVTGLSAPVALELPEQFRVLSLQPPLVTVFSDKE